MATKRAAAQPKPKKKKSGKAKRSFSVERGRPHPLGAVPNAKGVNFSIFSRHASSVELLLFNAHDDPEPVETILMDPVKHRSFYFWHVYVRGARPGMHYGFRIDGPRDIHAGHRFNPNKLLIDPYARGVTTNLWVRGDATGEKDNLATSLRGAIVDTSDYDWEGDTPLALPMSETVIYEMHVGGFTRSATSGVAHPGTFAGVVEKIPYLKELGVTAVELLPVTQFDDKELLRMGPDGQALTNYWGYSTIGFFAPHAGYCVMPDDGAHIREFRDMVKELHKNGIEVILDIVFNHTDEGNHLGPTISFKGFENSIYYHLVEDDKQYYMDYSGCGNTLNCNHPIVEKFILESLEFWVQEMHVDGFRFDEGSILARGQDGAPMAYPPVVWSIELSEVLADAKIIAEAWDAAGLYQIGYFPGFRWAEWNGRYRDCIRDFVRGEPGEIGAVAARMSGSADIYESTGHEPINSVNFITCHDGFTMNDVVSYNEKHNWANGEENRDGADDNRSWNCGVEGETEDTDIIALRERQIKNFAAILMLSQGVPMISMGDEVRRTQNGNNNVYCQDNELAWFDWDAVDEHSDVLRFFRRMIAFRKSHPSIHRSRFFTGAVNDRHLADVSWHGTNLNQPNWDDPEARILAFTLGGFGDDPDLHIMMNMFWEAEAFNLPTVAGRSWYRVIDTARPSPNDIVDVGEEVQVSDTHYNVHGRSIVVLMSK